MEWVDAVFKLHDIERYAEYLMSLKLCLVDGSGIPKSVQLSRELFPDALQLAIDHLPQYCLRQALVADMYNQMRTCNFDMQSPQHWLVQTATTIGAVSCSSGKQSN